MNTAFLLMAQYSGAAVIPVARVCEDYFSHLTPDKFLRKCSSGEIKLPVVRIDAVSQKGAKGIHLNDLAAYLDQRHAAAKKELSQMAGAT